MSKVRMETLVSIMDEFGCHESLRAGLDELIDPKMGVISSFQEIVDSTLKLREQDLGEVAPF